jgi:hypothetical protein
MLLVAKERTEMSATVRGRRVRRESRSSGTHDGSALRPLVMR